MIPQVNVKEAQNFSQVWTYKGISIPMSEAQLTFAADFANAVLKSFVEFCNAQAMQAIAAQKQAQQQAQYPSDAPNKLIVEA